jgi:nucleotide-binding universal stress UspA family protein
MRIRRILVPVDFSEPSLGALRYAVALARMLQASLDVLHVVEAVAYAPMVGPTFDLERLREEREHGARRKLEQLVARLGKRRGRKQVLLRVGTAARSIVYEAKRRSYVSSSWPRKAATASVAGCSAASPSVWSAPPTAPY